MVDDDLEGRVALVTGAASGIGRACAERLGRSGATVFVADRQGELAAEVSAGIDRSVPVEVDVGDERSVAAMAGLIGEAHGRIDVVVTAAGVVSAAALPLLETPLDEWNRLHLVNTMGTFLVIRDSVPLMPSGASIVTIASGSARRANPGVGAYAASKAAVWMMTKTLAIELGPRGIRVNAVGPGLIDTPMTRARLDDDAERERARAATALGRVGLPEDVAGTVHFLAGDASRYVTGEFIGVDGGKDAAQRG